MSELDEILLGMLCKAYSTIACSEDKLLKSMLGDTLSTKEFRTIDTIYKCNQKGNNTASKLAHSLGITMGTLTINIDRLIEKGYVQKIKNAKDKRITHIELTDKGKSLKLKHDKLLSSKIEDAIASLNNTEKVALVNAMSKFEI